MNLYDYILILAEKKRKVYSRKFGNVCAKAHPMIYVDRNSYLPILMGHVGKVIGLEITIQNTPGILLLKKT